eukprot:8361448-Prorocentrum_lima.AAC.1
MPKQQGATRISVARTSTTVSWTFACRTSSGSTGRIWQATNTPSSVSARSVNVLSAYCPHPRRPPLRLIR